MNIIKNKTKERQGSETICLGGRRVNCAEIVAQFINL